MIPEIYIKDVSPAGRTKYIPVDIVGTPQPDTLKIEAREAGALLGGVAIAMFASLSDQLSKHSRYARESDLFIDALARFIKITAGDPCEEILIIGPIAWRAALNVIVPKLSAHQLWYTAELQEKIDAAKAMGWT